MASARNSNISDELLSAYIDDAVTERERQQIEAALATDPDVAWRLASLRHTVQLLKDLPPLALPRSFILQEESVANTTQQRLARHQSQQRVTPLLRPVRTQRQMQPPPSPRLNFWKSIWQVGNPMWRNAAAACAVLLVLLLVGDNFVTAFPQRFSPMMSQGATATTTGEPQTESITAAPAMDNARIITQVATAAERDDAVASAIAAQNLVTDTEGPAPGEPSATVAVALLPTDNSSPVTEAETTLAAQGEEAPTAKELVPLPTNTATAFTATVTQPPAPVHAASMNAPIPSSEGSVLDELVPSEPGAPLLTPEAEAGVPVTAAVQSQTHEEVAAAALAEPPMPEMRSSQEATEASGAAVGNDEARVEMTLTEPMTTENVVESASSITASTLAATSHPDAAGSAPVTQPTATPIPAAALADDRPPTAESTLDAIPSVAVPGESSAPEAQSTPASSNAGVVRVDVVPTSTLNVLLQTLQIIVGGLALIFFLLWWRSRSSDSI